MRLAKYLAHAGVASRRAAEDDHRRRPRDGRRRGRHRSGARRRRQRAPSRSTASAVGIAGQRASSTLLNKPAGVVSTANDTHGRPTVVDLVAQPSERLYPVGRLDADTTGLILLTNDGELANRLTHPRYEVPKTYRARVANAPVPSAALRALREGVELDDGMTAPARVRQIEPDELEITIHEGRKRQVRRMCEAVGHRSARSSASRSARCGSARSSRASSRRLTRGRGRAAARRWHEV